MFWCTCAVLAAGWPQEIACDWRFTPKAIWTWRKADEYDQDQVGTAWCFANNSEHILWCTRGDFPSFPIGQQPLSCISAPRSQHSAKPDVFYELVSQHYPGMRKLEMYARKLRLDWDAWGNEAPPSPRDQQADRALSPAS
jgi:N6-adenosine-specific RNA methylase IME4